MSEILLGVSGFLSGAFLTMVVFVVGYNTKLTTVCNKVENIDEKLKLWEARGMPTCSVHQELERRLRQVEVKAVEND